jgi:hypothetical protein
MKRLLLGLLLSSSAIAFESDLSGNVEAQSRQSWNNDQAKEDLFQDWDQENFSLLYGNINGKMEHKGVKLESNIFARYGQSDLYAPSSHPIRGDEPYAAARIFTFPNRLVARDVFKLQYEKQTGNHNTEVVLNKLYLQWDYEEHRVTAGRMYINYGLGEIFNPLNPFNQPTGLTSISQVAQGSDGAAVAFFLSDKHTVEFLLLGDKRIEGYEGQIDRTLWTHGEYQASEALQLDYVIGEDQNRQKAGGQIAYRFSEAMIFSQLLYQSDFVTDVDSHPLWDAMLGFDQQLTSKWHLRFEGGHQKTNRYASVTTFTERFLPTEYFVAIANTYEVHPLIKLGGTVVNDVKSGFTYFITRNTFSLSSNIEAEIFGYIPAAKGDSFEYPAQKLVTTDVGAALRAFF